nr:hypothetical protein PJ912_06600 [Pectobacterium colocasium]
MTMPDFKRQLDKPEAAFFDTDAQQFADRLEQRGKKDNPTQLRRFYDQLQQLEQRINGDEEKLALYLPRDPHDQRPSGVCQRTRTYL